MRINKGDTVSCQECGHAREFSDAWMRELVETHFTKRSLGGIYLGDLLRFRCAMCGTKGAWLRTAAPRRAWELRYPVEAKQHDYGEPGCCEGYFAGGAIGRGMRAMREVAMCGITTGPSRARCGP